LCKPNKEVCCNALNHITAVMNKKLLLLPFAFILFANILYAQNDDKKPFGSLNIGLTMPQGDFKGNYRNGAHISVEVDAPIAKPLWFYGQGVYEAFATRDSVTNPNVIKRGSVGAAAGFKLIPVKFLYINAGAGLKLSVTPITDYMDNVSPYFNFGAGLWTSSTFGIFGSYTTWKAAKGRPADNYFVVGVSFGFGRK